MTEPLTTATTRSDPLFKILALALLTSKTKHMTKAVNICFPMNGSLPDFHKTYKQNDSAKSLVVSAA